MPTKLIFIVNLDVIKLWNFLIFEKTTYSQLNDITGSCPFAHRMNINKFGNDSTFQREQNGPLPCLSRSRGGTLHSLGSRHCRAMRQLHLRHTAHTVPLGSKQGQSQADINNNQIIRDRGLWDLQVALSQSSLVFI